MLHPTRFDVIVVGGGHAGTEAALAAAPVRMRHAAAHPQHRNPRPMSCNPSIGGIGKGHLVKEVDALGGDGRRHRRRRHPVPHPQRQQGPGRARPAPRPTGCSIAAIRRRLENQPNLWLFQQAVDDLTVVGDRVTGVVTQIGLRFEAPAVVLTAGTFLNGLVHVGLQNYSAGRAGDRRRSPRPRLKELHCRRPPQTGTPPRLDARTIDFR